MATPGNPSPSHWELPTLPPPDPHGQHSSTDLLNWWFRAHRHGGQWREFFGAAEPSAPAQTNAAPPMATAIPDDSWSELPLDLPTPDEQLADEHAQGAVDCLYDFLHAVGTRDLKAAATFVADDYHAIEQGAEIDKLRFMNGIAALLEEMRNDDISVSLAMAPEPVNHPIGILIHAVVQIDAANVTDGTKSGRAENRVAVLRQSADGVWQIIAFPGVKR